MPPDEARHEPKAQRKTLNATIAFKTAHGARHREAAPFFATTSWHTFSRPRAYAAATRTPSPRASVGGPPRAWPVRTRRALVGKRPARTLIHPAPRQKLFPARRHTPRPRNLRGRKPHKRCYAARRPVLETPTRQSPRACHRRRSGASSRAVIPRRVVLHRTMDAVTMMRNLSDPPPVGNYEVELAVGDFTDADQHL